MFDYDAELQRYNGLFRAATGVGPGDLVLDLGCGAGQSTRDAARAAAGGSVLGVDLSETLLERARTRSAAEGIRNVRFELADAQRHPFPDNHFHVAISRFGTMFFADPLEAFTNIGRALRPGGRLVMLVWQHSDRQEWYTEIRGALAGDRVPPETADADPFTLADPAATTSLLAAAGFTAVRHTEAHEPIYYGPDPAAARDAVLGLRFAADLLAEPADNPTPALDRLRATLVAHHTDRGVWFDSRTWLVTAHRH